MAHKGRYAPIPTRKPAKPSNRPRASRGPRTAIVATLLGAPKELVYRHAKDGKLYRHKFKAGDTVHYTHDGRDLIIQGARVKDGFIHG